MDMDKVKDFTNSLRESILPVKSKSPPKYGEIEGKHNIRSGVATAINCRETTLFFLPTALAEEATLVQLR